MSAWVNHIKDFSKKHSLTYGQALKNPECSKTYHATKSTALQSINDSNNNSNNNKITGNGITPIGRMGGKSKIAKQLIQMFPPFNTYVELFLGAGNIFLRIPQDELAGKKIVLNDLDKDMYTIFTGLKKDPKGINEKVRRKCLTKDEFNEIKSKKDVSSLITKYKNSYKL
jgi:hypothetical protein